MALPASTKSRSEARAPGLALHQEDAGHRGGHSPSRLKRAIKGGRSRRALGEHADATAVQNEHGFASASLLGVVLPDPPGGRLVLCKIVR